MECKCPICFAQFDEKDVRPLVGLCGHSICKQCVRPEMPCPICRKDNAFRERAVNYQLIDILSTQTSVVNPPTSEHIDRKFFTCFVCGHSVFVQTIRVCLDCCSKAGTLLDANRKLYNYTICATCFCEGRHTGHETVQYPKIKRDLDEFESAVSRLKMMDIRHDSDLNCHRTTGVADEISQTSAESLPEITSIVQNCKNLQDNYQVIRKERSKVDRTRAETVVEVLPLEISISDETVGMVDRRLSYESLPMAPSPTPRTAPLRPAPPLPPKPCRLRPSTLPSNYFQRTTFYRAYVRRVSSLNRHNAPGNK